jgi:hypothetical protein
MLDQNGSRKCWINLFLKFDSFPFISAISLRYGEAKEGSTRDQVKRQAHVFRKQGKELSLYTLDIRKNLLEDLYENKYLHPRGSVLSWIGGTGNPTDAVGNRFALDWLCRAIDSAHTRPGIKNAAKELLSVENFTSNLEQMEIYMPLNEHCLKSLGVIGKKLDDYFKKENLGELLGTPAVKKLIGQYGLECRRQDHPNVGLLPPAHQAGYPFFAEESVYIHVLRLVALSIDKGYQKIVKKICKDNEGDFSCGGIKGDSRIRSKALNPLDHGNEQRPRPAKNIDCKYLCFQLCSGC